MNTWTQTVPAADELGGDIRPLLGQIRSLPDGATLAEAGRTLAKGRIHSTADLAIFLREYQTHILRPLELPAIQRAYLHATRNELRELIASDVELAGESALKSFAAASKQIGATQLQRLRPLRDQRLAQRYLAAVENGEANGWHTLVYGLTLAIYSVPLRQGLLGYAQQVTRGFIGAAGRSLNLSPSGREQLLLETTADLPSAIEALIGQSILV